MSIKKILNELASEKAPGPRPFFTVLDIIRLFKFLAVHGKTGRGKISKSLGLGEGTIRTLLNRLTEANLIVKSRSGCSLTSKGRELWKRIERIIPKIVEIEENELTFTPFNVAVLIKGCAEKVGSGMEQRDVAVAAGAKGAVILLFKNNKLVIPGVSANVEEDYPIAFRKIVHLMNPEENDVIIISGADTLRKAEYGAIASAWSLINCS
ncbi:hypothetical protein J7L29_03740 [Candidatus Bathyarchaeota archaeon]|nr:hypothetical protein [Candidatus Bathyarchaeota archaeon]